MPVDLVRHDTVALVRLHLDGGQLDRSAALLLQARCHEIEDEPSLHAVVITGAEDVFCLDEVPGDVIAPDPVQFTELPDTPGRIATAALAGLPLPAIAAVNGRAVGAGAEVALACDMRLAGGSAVFQFTQVASGRVPSAGGTQRLPRIVGPAHALELLLLGEPVEAQDALRRGLVTRVVDGGRLEAEALALAARIAAKAPVAVRYLREAVHKGMDVPLEQGLRLEGDLYFLVQTTADRMEGIRAFLERREPRFQGS